MSLRHTLRCGQGPAKSGSTARETPREGGNYYSSRRISMSIVVVAAATSAVVSMIKPTTTLKVVEVVDGPEAVHKMPSTLP